MFGFSTEMYAIEQLITFLAAKRKSNRFFAVLNDNIPLSERYSKILGRLRFYRCNTKSLFLVVKAGLQENDLLFFYDINQPILLGYAPRPDTGPEML